MGTRIVKRTSKVIALIVVSIIAGGVRGAPADARQGITLGAALDGTDVRESGDHDPIDLDPDGTVAVHVTVRNDTSQPVLVRTVRLDGRVLGLTFFAYDTRVGLQVAPGTTEELTFDLDLAGLGGQATGLVRGSVAVLDPDRHVVASAPVTVKVKGRLTSVYGLFGLAVVLLTLVSAAAALLGLARGRLAHHRWSRATRFLTPGIGVGLSAVFTLSALGVWAPTTARTLLLVVVPAAISLALGYLTPAPDDHDEAELVEDEPDEPDESERVEAEPPRASGEGSTQAV
jgi:hypothetical protein